MSEKIDQSKLAREIIKMDLILVLNSFDKFLEISDTRKDLFLSPKNYNAFVKLFNSIKSNVSKIIIDDIINIDDWKYVVHKINVIESKFREHKGFINHYFAINKSELTHDMDSIRGIYPKLENSKSRDRLEKSTSDSETPKQTVNSREKKGLFELIKEDVDNHGMFLEEDIENRDLSDYQDFILFSFFGEKQEILLSPLNQAFGEYLLSQGDEYASEITSFDLEDIRNEVETETELKGGYEFTAVILENVEDEIIVTTKNNNEILLNFDSIPRCDSGKVLGEYFYEDSRLIGADFVHIESTYAPADMAGLFLLKEKVDKFDIKKNLCFLTASGVIVGLRYKDQDYPFALGNIGDIESNYIYLVTIDKFRKLTEF